MKTKGLIVAVSGLTLLLCSSLAVAQSLGDVARQARQQRDKETKKPAKVFTNENLPAPHPAEEPTPAASVSAPETEAASAQPESGTAPAEEEAAAPAGEEAAAPAEPTTAAAEAAEQTPEDKQRTREYWQAKFKAARQKLADAEEIQGVAEDELSLLQIQQARELSADVQGELGGRITAKTAEVETRRAETAKAQKALEDLGKEFRESGAPDNWSKTD